jgi:hypothetical protein
MPTIKQFLEKANKVVAKKKLPSLETCFGKHSQKKLPGIETEFGKASRPLDKSIA